MLALFTTHASPLCLRLSPSQETWIVVLAQLLLASTRLSNCIVLSVLFYQQYFIIAGPKMSSHKVRIVNLWLVQPHRISKTSGENWVDCISREKRPAKNGTGICKELTWVVRRKLRLSLVMLMTCLLWRIAYSIFMRNCKVIIALTMF